MLVDSVNKMIEDNRLSKHKDAIIRQINEILQAYINEYTSSYYEVISPISDRNNREVGLYDFTIKDMRDSLKSSIQLKNFGRSAIESFLESELVLRNEIEDILKHEEIKDNTELAGILKEYVKVSIQYNFRPMLSSINNDNKIKMILQDQLDGNPDEIAKDIKAGIVSSSNILTGMIALREMMLKERKVILCYNKIIEKLLDGSVSY